MHGNFSAHTSRLQLSQQRDAMLVKKYGTMTTSTLIIPERHHRSERHKRLNNMRKTLGSIHKSRDIEESFCITTAQSSSCTCLRRVPGLAEAIYNRWTDLTSINSLFHGCVEAMRVRNSAHGNFINPLHQALCGHSWSFTVGKVLEEWISSGEAT